MIRRASLRSTGGRAFAAALVLVFGIASTALSGSAKTTLASVSSSGEAANARSGNPAVSGDGRFVAFVSYATNLDTSGASGLFVRDNKTDPMFTWSWGYYSIFDADAVLFDVMTCNQPYSYYCNKVLDDLVIQGRSTLYQKKRAEIYAKAQKLIHDDAAYLYKWGLRGVWGVSNRIEYDAPKDEVDRMWAVTPRKK